MTASRQLPHQYPVTSHTDHVAPGSTFVAIQGAKENGAHYIAQAIERGATKIVIQQEVQLSQELYRLMERNVISLLRVADPRATLATLSAQAFGHPARKLKIIGVTGTKGKTTTTFLIEHILREAGYKTALTSSVLNAINGVEETTKLKLATQQPDYLHLFLHTCVQERVEYVAMEVSAQALSLHRVLGIDFEHVVFTNFSQEHAEFYPTLEDYFSAKLHIFDALKKDGKAFINADDSWGKKILTSNSSFVGYTNITQFSCPSLIGDFNAYNIAAATHIAQAVGISGARIQDALQTFSHVPGRMERYALASGATCIIDYAHNPSSYQALLPTLKKMTHQLIVVFGCGGERDATKRPVMGSIAAEIADHIILTTDNPRSEDPHDITQQIYAGIPDHLQHKVLIEMDRATAIRKACALSQKGSIIALLGKGPDEFQEIKGEKFYFSEREIIQSL